MVLNYRATNCIGWPLPAFLLCYKITKNIRNHQIFCQNNFLKIAKIFSHISELFRHFFTKPSNTFLKAMEKVLRSLVAIILPYSSVTHRSGKKSVSDVYQMCNREKVSVCQWITNEFLPLLHFYT